MKKYKMLILGLATTMIGAAPVFAKKVNEPIIVMEEKALHNILIINGRSIEDKIYTEKGQNMLHLRKSAEAIGLT